MAATSKRGADLEIDEETRARRRIEKQAAKEAGLVKRKVGLHIGYVGTNYSGLQLSRLEHVKTIEGVLKTALQRSGCVTEANSQSLSKVNWSRSSRTDKGVHSLATVVALKCLVEETRFDDDREGLELAQRISAELPSEIRVFSVQRVNDGFFARKACMTRTYAYYVPLRLLTQDTADTDAALARFRTALGMYTGRHAFHNYTKRKQYIENNDSWSYGRKQRQKRHQQPSHDEESEEEQEEPPTNSNSTPVLDFEALLQRERETGRWRFWNLEFKEMNDPRDRIVAPHYRNILSFAAEDPAPVIPGGVSAVCCTVKGDSFMLHQIRYMIGTAVAVACGCISVAVLEASLKACIRIQLPMALALPLILVDNAFSEFPSNRGEPPVVSKWSGDRLELRSGGLSRQQQFHESTLMPEINRLLQLEDWDRWDEMLKLVQYDESRDADVAQVMVQYDAWVKEKQEMKAAKREALEQELKERGIDHATWRQERRERNKNAKAKTL